MSYTIEDLTSIDDGIFDTLWNASHPKIESGGTMPWSKIELFAGHQLNAAEKKAGMKDIFTEACADLDDRKLYLCRKDGTPIRMFNATNLEGASVICHYTLYGPDALGSRAWLYDPIVLKQTRDQLTADFGATGHTIHVMTGSPMHTYYLERPNSNEHSLTETQADGVSTIIFTYN